MSESETNNIRNRAEQTQFREHTTPLYLTSSFSFESAEQGRALFADEIEGNIYSRFSNPNVSEFIEKVALMEGAEDGFAFASGMAAVFSSMAAFLKSGDHILACRSVFGSTHQLFTNVLPGWGITTTYVDADKPETWEAAIQPNTKYIYIETPSNPGLELIDLEWLGKLKEKHKLILNVDNCFATPYLQQPIVYGADLVTHSATKYMDGQGRVLGGIVVGKKDLIAKIRYFARHTGPSLSPFNAWVLSKSLETLSLRMDKHSEQALAVAKHLEEHSEIEKVKYPFLPSHPQHELAKKQMKLGGGIVSFTVKGGLQRAIRFIDNVQMFTITANLGDTRTIVTHPASMTHAKLSQEERLAVGIEDGLIRISVGLESLGDIFMDLDQALSASR